MFCRITFPRVSGIEVKIHADSGGQAEFKIITLIHKRRRSHIRGWGHIFQ